MDEMIKELQKATKALQDTNDKREEEVKKFGESTAETQKKMDDLNEQITKMQDQLNEMATKQNRRHQTEQNGKSDEQIEKEMKQKSAFLKFMRAGGRQDNLDAEEKKAIADVPMHLKALVEDSLGELIVPEDVDREIQMAVHDQVIMRQLARVVPTSSNRMRRTMFNKLTAGYGKLETNVDNYDVKKFESDVIPAREWLFVQNLYALTGVGEDQLMDSEFNLTQIITQMFAEAFAYTEGNAFMNGRGNNYEEPEGLLVDPFVKHFKLTTDAKLLDGLLSLQYAPKDKIARDNGVYIINAETELYTRTQKDDTGNYMWQPPVQAGKPASLFGKPVYKDDSIGKGAAAVYGDIKRAYTILDRNGMTIRRYDQAASAMENDIIPFRAKARNGGGVTRPEAVAVLETEVPNLGGKLELIEVTP
ncbi:phage major capsid protein [Sporosarcina soli]|uniref:Phage major capsid protein n=1 Tax=Sporosarcina soli TaxID=334736 RepID=A0ABW0TE06_9BACL